MLVVQHSSLLNSKETHADFASLQAEKIGAILAAANIKVAPYWPGLFARVLAGRNIDDLILTAGGSGAAPAAAGGAAAAPAQEEKKEEKGGKKKEEKKEESEDGDMGFGLFD